MKIFILCGADDNSPYSQEPCECESLTHGSVVGAGSVMTPPTITGQFFVVLSFVLPFVANFIERHNGEAYKRCIDYQRRTNENKAYQFFRACTATIFGCAATKHPKQQKRYAKHNEESNNGCFQIRRKRFA